MLFEHSLVGKLDYQNGRMYFEGILTSGLPPIGTEFYRVREGDTCDSIARKFGITRAIL